MIRKEKDRIRIMKRASWYAILGNAVLSVLKIGAGVATGTLSVLGDGLDSLADVLVSGVSLVVAHLLEKKPTREYPFGFGRAEPMATMLVGLVIFYAGAQFGLGSIRVLWSPPPFEPVSGLAVGVTLVSIAGKLALSRQQIWFGRRIRSGMLLANGKNMAADVWISVAVLAGLGLVHGLRAPRVDALVSLLISAMILRVAVGIFRQTHRDLMDGIHDTDIYEVIAEQASSVPGVGAPHRIRARRLGIRYLVYLDIEVDPDTTVREAHRIATEVEASIREGVEDVYDVMVHVEPEGNVEEETYGVSVEPGTETPP